MFNEQLNDAIEYALSHGSFNKLNLIEAAENVCVFGLGKYFREAFVQQNIKEKFHVNLLCDNNPEKWGRKYEDILCVSPAELKDYKALVVIIMLGDAREVEKQLSDMNICYMQYLELSLDYIMDMPKDKEWFEAEKEHIVKALELYEDEESKRVYVNGLCNRIAPCMSRFSWAQLYNSEGEFFNQNHFKFTNNEVYVDCGAFDGDTIIEFIEAVNDYDKIYAFELDQKNFSLMEENVKDIRNIICFNYGVWNEDKEIEYEGRLSENDPADGISIYKSGKSASEKTDIAYLKKLDDVLSGERITFIKMDIEGAEVNALKGAEQVIRSQKPKLAVCVYHRTSDFWQIPLLLKQYNKNYVFTLRHNVAVNCWGTVLYAY